MKIISYPVFDVRGYFSQLSQRLATAGISHAALARESGMHPTALSRLFRESTEKRTRINPRKSTIDRLEQAFVTLKEAK